jgi:transcriptional regulator with XRE-family HTH domain
MDSDLPFVMLVALAIRAGRRRRGMSQRTFGEAAGLSQSRVARLETGKVSQLADVRLALAMVGLRLALVDETGRQWTVDMALDLDAMGIVDRAGRRFPAHLPEDTDVWIPYWRQFRDERAGYRDRGPWTYRRDTPERLETRRRFLRDERGPPPRGIHFATSVGPGWRFSRSSPVPPRRSAQGAARPRR